MSTKDSMITDISAELDKEFGMPGTPQREQFEEEAYAFYTAQILLDANALGMRIDIVKPLC